MKNPFLLLGQARACGIGIALLEMAGKNETEFWEECPYLPPV